MRLIHFVGQQRLQVIPYKRIYGCSLPTFSLLLPGIKKLATKKSLALTLLLFLGNLFISTI